MTVLICGSRDWQDGDAIRVALSACRHLVSRVVHGGARGADTLGGAAAEALGIPVTVYAADWNRHGRAAGPIRNQQMLDEAQPGLVLAFTLGTPGTADMIRRAEQADVPCWVFTREGGE